MSNILTETTCPLEMLGEKNDNRCRMGRDSTETSNTEEKAQSNTGSGDNVNSYTNESSLGSGTSNRSNVMAEFSLKVHEQGISVRVIGSGLELLSLLEYSYVENESVRKILRIWMENSPALNGGGDGNK